MFVLGRGTVAIALVALPACELLANIPDYTTEAPSDGNGGDGTGGDGSAGDGPAPECQTSAQCTAPEVCVMGTCGPCDSDAHCGPADANVCLPDGTCAALDRIAYASPTGAGGACTLTTPCSVEQAFSLAAGSPGIDIVKLAATSYTRDAQLNVGDDTVILAGEGATLNGGANVQILRVADGSLTVIGATLVGDAQFNTLCFAQNAVGRLHLHRTITRAGAYGAGGFGCDVTLTRSTVTQNTAIGAYIQGGTARIANSVFLGNGTGGGAAGGLQLLNVSDARVELSTFAGNTSAAPENAGAMTCGGSTTTITSSIIWGNSGSPPLDGACNVDYSVVEPSYGAGAHNVRTDPQFVAAGDFHVQATSPARGAADPAVTITVDRDGEPRPQGAGASDSGADEVP